MRLVVLFGALGYLFAKIGCEPAPMLLGFVLGPMMEEYFRRALVIERGDFRVFIERPISAGLLAVALALLVSMSLPAIAKLAAASGGGAGARLERRMPDAARARPACTKRRRPHCGVRPRPWTRLIQIGPSSS